MLASVVILGASTTVNGVPLWQAVLPVGDASADVESFGEIDVLQGLGLYSMPWPADAAGHAEAFVIEGVAGLTAVAIGGRDTRTAKIAGLLKPGDTVVSSTGPSMSAQVMLKESKRQVVLATKNKKDETQALLVDGASEKFQVAVGGCMIEIADGGVSIVDKTGKAGILIRNGTVAIFGKVVLGGLTPNPAFSIMLGPVTGSPGAGAAAPMVAAKGVFIGL